MRLTLACLFVTLALPAGSAAFAQEPPEQVEPAEQEQPAVDQDRPPERERKRGLRGEGRRPRDQQPDRRPPGRGEFGRPRGPGGGMGGPGPGGGGRRGGLLPWEPLLRGVAERRPELAERLDRLRKRDPRLFHDVLTEALMSRLEDVLNEAEESEEQRPRKRRGGPPPGVSKQEHESHLRVMELHDRHKEREKQTEQLAKQARELRKRGGSTEEATELREQLRQSVNEHFDIRTELRRLELQRIEGQLQHLNEMVEKLREELERRETERSTIIERRVSQLLGEDEDGW